jgi:Flp pilus assembly protein protease CpaA
MKPKHYLLITLGMLILFAVLILSDIIKIRIRNWGDFALLIVVVLLVLWRIFWESNWWR